MAPTNLFSAAWVFLAFFSTVRISLQQTPTSSMTTVVNKSTTSLPTITMSNPADWVNTSVSDPYDPWALLLASKSIVRQYYRSALPPIRSSSHQLRRTLIHRSILVQVSPRAPRQLLRAIAPCQTHPISSRVSDQPSTLTMLSAEKALFNPD